MSFEARYQIAIATGIELVVSVVNAVNRLKGTNVRI